MCVGCSGASGVLTCAAHLFSGRGRCAVTGGRLHARATPIPQGVTAFAPSAPTPLGRRTHGIPSRLLSPRCAHFVSRPHCRVCVKHSRAGCMRAQNAVPPHSHVARVPSLPHYRDWLSSLTLGGAAAVLPMSRFLVCAVLSRVSRIIAVPPLPRV